MTTGTLFDIQPYAVHDGPGIRTLVFLKGCPLACQWCCNPESQAFKADLRQDAWRCLNCLRCLDACPAGAMALVDGHPKPDRSACATCASFACTATCPGGALVRVGREMTADAVIAEVAKDADFFRNSGGGVTFSGGEPFAQPAFLEAMLRRCRALKLPTAVETCGHMRLQDLQACEPWVDLFLFDLKVLDPARHRALTGSSNDLILSNLRWLAKQAREKIIIRHAIIPGLNDDEDTHEALADLMVELGLETLELEPYHPLGESKYEGLGRTFAGAPPGQVLDETRLASLLGYFAGRGLKATLA